MATATRRWAHRCRYPLLALVAIGGFGCAGIGGASFIETPLAPASRVYPTVAGGCACAATPAAARWFERVLIIVLENQDYEDAIAEPYLGRLAKEGAVFTNYHGLFHPSYPNYLAMIAGAEIVTAGDRQRNLNQCTIADLLPARGLTWKAYAQGYPGPDERSAPAAQCVKVDALGRYARKHVPFISFVPIQRHQCRNIVAASRFDDDRQNASLPNYAFYAPDIDNDGHDTSLAYAASWLKDFLKPLRRDPDFMKDTLVIVTFDESRHRSRANHIYTVFLGPMVKPQRIGDNYNHYNLLRTIETNFGLCPLGPGDGGAKAITSVWK